ncbi:MAG: hypothetical protein H6811_04645 [Phycisphaeraceae bacterium]|nr:hypothetical protein [Phycisphaeraceae bacterium]
MHRGLANALLSVLTAVLAGPVLAALVGSSPPLRGLWNASALSRTALSVGCAALVASLATIVAWPLAWVALRVPSRWLGLFLLPMLLPNYLAYAGWSVLRDPSIPTGDWLVRLGSPALSLLAGRAMAVGGLALWSWPLVWICLWSGARRLDPCLLDALSLEGATRVDRITLRVRLLRRQLVLGFVLTLLVMLGNPVPFDLAQIDTLANASRAALAMGQESRAWSVSLPLVGAAALSALGATMALDRNQGSESRSERKLLRAVDVLPIALVLGISVFAPLLLFAATIRSSHAFGRALAHLLEPMGSSLFVGAGVAIGGVLVYLTVFAALTWGRGARLLARACTAFLIATALIPGVLVGSSFASVTNSPFVPRWVADSSLPLIVTHLARFSVIPAVVATLVWIGEGSDRARQRRLDGGDRPRGLVLLDVPAQASILLGTAAAMASLSIHEIEASVLLTPPGSRAISQVLLSRLHYQRQDDLAAGVLLITTVGFAAALIAALAFGGTLGTRASRRP